MKIVAEQCPDSVLSGVVLKLEGFQMIMSYVGCIGQIMASSDLKEVFEVIYAENTVSHLISGKVISRAVRAHFIVQSALYILLMASYGDDSYNMMLGDLTVKESQYLKKLFHVGWMQSIPVEDIRSDTMLN